MRSIKAFLAALTFLAVLVPVAAFSEQKEINIGLIPEMNIFKQMQRFQPLAEYLSEKTGAEIKLSMLSRYGNIIEKFQSRELDGAFFGSFTGAMAIAKLGLVPVARPLTPTGAATYHGYIFVRKDSGIKGVPDMKGKTVAFVEKATTAGYIFPMAYFKENGVTDIKGYFREYFFAGSHDAAIDAVLKGSADVGAAKNTIYDIKRKQDPRIDKELVILAESPKVPSNGLCFRPDMDPALREKIRTILLGMHNDPRGRLVLEKLYAIKFVPTGVEDYAPVFDLAEKAGIDLKGYQYRNE